MPNKGLVELEPLKLEQLPAERAMLSVLNKFSCEQKLRLNQLPAEGPRSMEHRKLSWSRIRAFYLR